MNRTFFLASIFATAVSFSMAGAPTAGSRRPAPPPNLVRPTIWMGAGESGPPPRPDPDPAEITRLLALMKSDDEVERFSAAIRWVKESIGSWPHVLSMEKEARFCSKDGIGSAFLLYAQGILDWNELPEDVRLTLLRFVLDEVARPEDPPGDQFGYASGLLRRFVPDWAGSDARREAALLSIGDGVPDETRDFRTRAFRELDDMDPYARIHRSLESLRANPLASIPDAGRDSEAVRVAEAAEYLSRFAFGWICGGGESAEHFFRRKGIGPAEGFRVLATIIEETAGKPERTLVREQAILALQCTDVPEAFDYAARLMETEKGFMATAAKSSATRLAEGNTNRLIRLQSLTDRLPPPGHEPPL